jgi:hypothetical protein
MLLHLLTAAPGTSRQIPKPRIYRRYRCKADICGQAVSAEPVANDPGCVKTLEAFIGTQQRKSHLRPGESSCAGGILFAFIFCPNDQQNVSFTQPKLSIGGEFCCGAQWAS